MSLEFLFSVRIFQSVEKRFRRIDEVLPSRNYSLRDLLSQLRSPRIAATVKRRLGVALDRFDRGEYGYVLQECGETGEVLFASYRQSVGVDGCGGIPSDTRPALEHIRKWLGDGSSTDKQGVPFARRNRIEWFLLSMFEALHYLRNSLLSILSSARRQLGQHPEPSPGGMVAYGHGNRHFADGMAIPRCSGDAKGLLRNLDSISRGQGPRSGVETELQRFQRLTTSKDGASELIWTVVLRNLSHHAPEVVDGKLPPWQVSRRQDTAEGPDLSRLALSLCFQIALELEALFQHQDET